MDFPPEVGGIQTVAYRLCQSFRRVRPMVIAPRAEGDRDFDRQQGFAVLRVGRRPPKSRADRALTLARMLLTAFPLIRQGRPVGVLCMQPLTAPLALCYRRIMGLPYAVYAHGMELLSGRGLGALRRAERVIAVSRYTRGLLLARGVSQDRIVVIGHGVDGLDGSALLPDPFLRHPSLRGKRLLLTVSRLSELYKGHDVVLRSLPLVAARVPDVAYIVVGDGALRPYYEGLAASLGQTPRVTFIGRANQPTVEAWYRACDLLVMVSRDRVVDGGAEGFGLVYLEANRFGKPVVAGSAGGAPDAVLDRETGILVDPEDEIAVSGAIIELLSDPALRARLGRQGQQRVLHERRWLGVAEQVEDVILGMIDGPVGKKRPISNDQ
jgi:phosphatidylinositol alpha-1,6-mannosyltransferase